MTPDALSIVIVIVATVLGALGTILTSEFTNKGMFWDVVGIASVVAMVLGCITGMGVLVYYCWCAFRALTGL